MFRPFLKTAPYMRMDLNRDQEILKPEFKSMTENFHANLHQEESKQSKGAKICASIN